MTIVVKRAIFTIITAITVLATLVSPIVVRAQESKQGFVVSPPTFELSANPGDNLKNSIRIDNVTNGTLTLSTAVKNFSALGEEGQVGLSDEESRFSLAKWITVTPSTVQIPAKESKTFDFTIQVPSNAEPGGHFGSVVFKSELPKLQENVSAVGVGQEIGALVLLRVAGNVKERASIASFKTSKSLFEHGPVAFETRLKNDGNVHVKSNGTITITNLFGHKVASAPVSSKNVLPGATRVLSTDWNARSAFGKYTATVSVQYSSNQPVITASTTFFVVPYKLVLVWTVVLIAVGFLLFRARHRILLSLRILFGKQ
jgi:hypothetical protein